jgi:hypothetical protein
MFDIHPTEIARILQAVIAPAFLLAGIGTFVNVMTQRLSRVIDRARELEVENVEPDLTPHAATRSSLRERLYDVLVLRARLINRAITLCTAAAVAVCLLIALLFADTLITGDFSIAVSLVFLVAMATLITALLTFLREVFVSTDTLRKAYLRAEPRSLRKVA